MRHITALLLLSSPASCMMLEATSYALDILFHIGIYTDVTGTRRMKKTLSESWMTNPFESTGIERCEYNRRKKVLLSLLPTLQLQCILTTYHDFSLILLFIRELLLLSTSTAFSANSKDTYTQASAHLFPVLLRWLRCSDRGIVLRVVRVLGRLGSVPENVLSLDMMCPDEDFGYLVQLLCASETAVEALRTVRTAKGQLPSQMLTTPYKEPSKLNASITEDFNEFSDVQLRDAVLETLVAFCSPYSATIKERIAAQPRCIHLIARIALRSSKKPKSDGFSKDAISLLSLLSTEPKNRKKILPVMSSLSQAALSDDAIAGNMPHLNVTVVCMFACWSSLWSHVLVMNVLCCAVLCMMCCVYRDDDLVFHAKFDAAAGRSAPGWQGRCNCSLVSFASVQTGRSNIYTCTSNATERGTK
jgi:hypothetical protein